jgi:sulfite exporter TauE/SafE
MTGGLIVTALLAGLAGGPHCVGMCGSALCGGAALCAAGERQRLLNGLLLGRALGYAAAGALAAGVVGALRWSSGASLAIKPLWTLLQVAAVLLGLVLLWRAQQPVWLEQAGQRFWRFVSVRRGAPASAAWPAGLKAVGAGLLWAALPCGLLYSALMMAALADSAAGGAAVMLAFAAGSTASLQAWQWLWQRLTRYEGGPRDLQGAWGLRIAGLALALTAGWGLAHGLWQDVQAYCTVPQ